MATSPTAASLSLRIERTIAAAPERVFDAFTKAETLSRWFGPNDDYKVTVHELDARIGGRYRIEMRNPERTSFVGGIYDEVSRPSRLAFSWEWEDKPQHGRSRVSISFEPSGGGTKLVLVQEKLPTAEAREGHLAGWNGCLERLTRML